MQRVESELANDAELQVHPAEVPVKRKLVELTAQLQVESLVFANVKG
jgi:hypothetical protein